MVEPIILWVPGTSNHSINTAFQQALPLGMKAGLVDYEASWDLPRSVQDGVHQLEMALHHAYMKKKRGQKIVLAGESQGAWVIAQTLSNRNYNHLVDKVVLLGLPGIAPTKFRGTSGMYPTFFGGTSRFLEISHRFDYATFRWSDSKKLQGAVARFMSGNLRDLPLFLSLAIHHPIRSAISGFLLLKHIPMFGAVIPNPHNYDDDMQTAVDWLLHE